MNRTRQQSFAAFSPIADAERAKLRRLRDDIARDAEARHHKRLALERAQTAAALDEEVWRDFTRNVARLK